LDVIFFDPLKHNISEKNSIGVLFSFLWGQEAVVQGVSFGTSCLLSLRRLVFRVGESPSPYELKSLALYLDF
jgi:hypothetical protein